jgi:hypothetical protein
MLALVEADAAMVVTKVKTAVAMWQQLRLRRLLQQLLLPRVQPCIQALVEGDARAATVEYPGWCW